MLCKSPVGIGVNWYVPCGRCTQCKIKAAKLWASRIELETTQHNHSSFVTLTYDEEHLPHDLSVQKKTLADWLKRIRKAVEPLRLRFFGVGEYGKTTQRPHYHVALFGYEPCRRGSTDLTRRRGCCPQCDLLRKTWGYGSAHCTWLTPASARYVAGYVADKLIGPEYAGRVQPFRNMSRDPGLGAWCAPEIARTLKNAIHHVPLVDVPHALGVGKNQHMLLGRYLRRLIREEMGWPPDTPQEALAAYAEKMQLLSEYAKQVGISPKQILIDLSSSASSHQEFFENLRKRKRGL